VKTVTKPDKMSALESAASQRVVTNFTDWDLDECLECYGATDEEMDIYAKVSFW
jgi:hypothetical protein